MSRPVPIAQAKARFAEFVRRAEAGETVVLTRHGRPVATLVSAAAEVRGADRPVAEIRERPQPYAAAGPGGSLGTPPGARESRRAALARLLEESIWTRVPGRQLGRRIEKRERERILGYGDEGV